MIDPGDFDNTENLAGSLPLSGGSGYFNRTHIIDVTAYISVTAGSTTMPGFLTTVSWWDVHATLNPVAGLRIEYDLLAADGDINGDTMVDAADVLLAQQVALGELLPNDLQLWRGDVAPPGAVDGRIDAADLLLITRKALGHTTAF